MNDENLNAKPTAAPQEAEHTRTGVCYRPNVDIIEKTDELVVLADVPGALAADVDVKFEEGTLSIFARVQPRREENSPMLVEEYGVGDYYRTFRISEAIDAAKITAEYTDGVLTLHLPKAEASKPRKIAVQAGS